MGAATKAIIKKGTTLNQVVNALKCKYKNVSTYSTSESFLFFVCFDVSKKETGRCMDVFFRDFSDYKIQGVLLSLSAYGSSIDILKYLCETFGGYLDENDCDDEEFYPIRLDLFGETRELTEYSILVTH